MDFFKHLDSFYIAIGIALFIYLMRLIYSYYQAKNEIDYDIHSQKKQITKLVEEREERKNMEVFDEGEFWKLVEDVSFRSKSNFSNFLGLFKDKIRKYQPDDLIKIDNLLMSLFLDNLNQDFLAASYIIFKSPDFGNAQLLNQIFISRGQVFFKNAVINPKLIIGKRIEGIEGRLINDIVSDLYYEKAHKLIPFFPGIEELKIEGEKWDEKDLPSRYPELWDDFLVVE